MRNASLDEAQAEIKIARRNINNLRYADETTLIWSWKVDPVYSPLSKILILKTLKSKYFTVSLAPKFTGSKTHLEAIYEVIYDRYVYPT